MANERVGQAGAWAWSATLSRHTDELLGEADRQRLVEMQQTVERVASEIAALAGPSKLVGSPDDAASAPPPGRDSVRPFLMGASDSDLDEADANEWFGLDDVMAVALDGLERSNAIAETTIFEAGRARRAIDRNNRALEAERVEIDRELKALLDG